jgi:hypothetical protein
MPATRLRAGVARSDITTAAPEAVVHDPLHAKALVLDDGATRVAIVAMDAVAIGGIGDIGDDFLPRLRERVEAELAIPGEHLLVNASHTHPPGRILCDDAEQVERVFSAVRRAAEGMVPVTVGAGVGREDRVAINRTLRLRDGSGWTIRHTNPCPPDEEVVGLGPIDPEIGVLRVDRLDGRPLALAYNFACHPLLGVPGGAITANFPGFASAVIEESLGEGAMALFLQGACGDVTEVAYKDVGRPRDSRAVGTMLGLSTLRAHRAIGVGVGELRVVNEPLALPWRTDIPERVAELRHEQAELLASLRFTSLSFDAFLPLYLKHAMDPERPTAYSYRYLQAEALGSGDLAAMDAENRANLAKYLANIRAMERLARMEDRIATYELHHAAYLAAGEPTMPTEVQGIRIGDFVVVTSPAEVLTEVGLNIKAASPHPRTFIAAMSNGYIHYGPPAGDYAMGGYEVTECRLAPEWQALYEAKVAEVLARL